MKQLSFALHYIQHYLKASSYKGSQPSFVSDLLTKAVYVTTRYYPYLGIEKIREDLIDSPQTIERYDLGTGKSGQTKISSIAKHSAKSPEQAQLLFRLVNYFQPKNVLELGTSLGISTCYLAAANSATKVTSIEGCPNTAAIAKRNFERLNLKNINLLVGNFNEQLPNFLKNTDTLHFVFFDGNHQQQATINYFNQCVEKVHNDTLFVFDDIHWSDEMTSAWEQIKNHPQVTITIDLFFMGFVFFRKQETKQHFLIRF